MRAPTAVSPASTAVLHVRRIHIPQQHSQLPAPAAAAVLLSCRRQVLIRPASKVVIKFLQLMMKHGYIGEFEVRQQQWLAAAGVVAVHGQGVGVGTWQCAAVVAGTICSIQCARCRGSDSFSETELMAVGDLFSSAT
jgi:hypothetical protein